MLELKVEGKCSYDHCQSFMIYTIRTIHTVYDAKINFINPEAKYLKYMLVYVLVCA
jgi:hypothetical protein